MLPCATTPLIPVYSEYIDFYLFRSSTPLGSQGTASPISQHTCHFPLGQGKHSVPISYAELSFFPIYFEYFQLGSGLKINAHIHTMNFMKYITIRGANNKTTVQNNKQTKKEVYRIHVNAELTNI